ncbi:MAG: NUDIX hydrolase [Gammaproteobacteria bacterium]|nr:MAG: NUDIX hydrolase [Gammaproteobacteria bacterium]
MNNGIDVTVAAITERAGRFLMVEERVSGNAVINQPAGHLEPGESLVEAVIRETLEETAWALEPEAVTGIYLWQTPDQSRSFLRVAFAGQCRGHDPERTLDTGIIAAHWLTREDVAAQAARLRSPMVIRCIDDYLAGIRYPLDCLTLVEAASPLQALSAAG